MNRMPLFQTAGIHTFFNGPESFTPDDRYYLGEAPELGGYWIAAGYNSVGIAGSGGAGHGAGALDHRRRGAVRPVGGRYPPRPALPEATASYLKERVTETLGLLYADHFPYRQVETARGVRRSPAARASEGARRGLWRGCGLGAGELVREPGAGAGVSLFLEAAELVRQPARRTHGGADRGRASST